VSRAFDATVMVVVADIVDGRLRARGGGSGVIVGKDGSILTNYHVIHDRAGRLHDAFVIGRFSEQDKAPQLHCAGKPSRSKLQRELDLAADQVRPRPRRPELEPGARRRDLADLARGAQHRHQDGPADLGAGLSRRRRRRLTLSEGEVEGWSGVDGAVGRDFIKTDAANPPWQLGRPVVGDDGKLVGIASAVRTKLSSTGDVVEWSRPAAGSGRIAAASDLLAIAAAGWTPREGQTDVELQLRRSRCRRRGADPEPGARRSERGAGARCAGDGAAVRGQREYRRRQRLDDQVLAYGRSTAQARSCSSSRCRCRGRTRSMVVARGYEPMIGEGELTLEANTPAVYDPWGKLLLRAR